MPSIKTRALQKWSVFISPRQEKVSWLDDTLSKGIDLSLRHLLSLSQFINEKSETTLTLVYNHISDPTVPGTMDVHRFSASNQLLLQLPPPTASEDFKHLWIFINCNRDIVLIHLPGTNEFGQLAGCIFCWIIELFESERALKCHQLQWSEQGYL